MFVRENKKLDAIISHYVYIVQVEYISHSGDMPISFVCKLKEEMPAWMMRGANKSIV